MKKLLFALASALLLFAFSCKEDETPVKYSIEGTWQPLKMIETTVNSNNVPNSDVYYYTDCQKQSRFTFAADKTGKVKLYDLFNGVCTLLTDKSYTYVYDDSKGDIIFNYVTYSDEGKVSGLTEKSMNLQIDKLENGVYTSKTYYMVKVNN